MCILHGFAGDSEKYSLKRHATTDSILSSCNENLSLYIIHMQYMKQDSVRMRIIILLWNVVAIDSINLRPILENMRKYVGKVYGENIEKENKFVMCLHVHCKVKNQYMLLTDTFCI